MGIFGWSYPPGAASDPQAPYNQTEDDWSMDLAALDSELKKLSTGRWEWDQIACCWTGKDADLEDHGHQGLSLTVCDEDTVHGLAHILVTVAGTDVCLNTPWDDAPDEVRTDLEEKALKLYLDQAENMVCGCSLPGEWDGDSWILADSAPFDVDWVMKGDGCTPDYEETAVRALEAAQKAIAPLSKEATLLGETLSMLAGWTTTSEKDINAVGAVLRCSAGKPGPFCSWADLMKEDGEE